jgi:hypothetical protein
MVLGKVPAARTHLVRNMVLGPAPVQRPQRALAGGVLL